VGLVTVVELFSDAQTTCDLDPFMAIEWHSYGDPLPVAPVEALVEWLRREACAVCGDSGCVTVEYVSLSVDNDMCDTVEEYGTPG
jgi:hypothetical protein